MVSFSLRQRIFLPPPTGPSPVSFHLSQFDGGENLENSLHREDLGLLSLGFRTKGGSKCRPNWRQNWLNV